MAESGAWLLNLDGEKKVAVGEREMLHLVENPVLRDVPKTPFYCRSVLIWQDAVTPVMDLGAWFAGRPVERRHAFICLVGYQERPLAPVQHGALVLSDIPSRIRVDDVDACDLPEAPEGWKHLAISCFSRDGGPVPILDLQPIFSGELLNP